MRVGHAVAPDRAESTSERVHVRRSADLADVEIVRVSASARLWLACHERWSLRLLRAGIAEARVCGELRTLAPESFLMLRPHQVCLMRPFAGTLCFDELLVPQDLIDDWEPSAARRAASRPSLRFQLLLAVLEQADSIQGRRGSPLQLLRAAFASLTPRLPQHAGLENARELLHACLDQNVPISELSRASGLSRFHFLRRFAAAYGLPPPTAIKCS